MVCAELAWSGCQIRRRGGTKICCTPPERRVQCFRFCCKLERYSRTASWILQGGIRAEFGEMEQDAVTGEYLFYHSDAHDVYAVPVWWKVENGNW
jgi:hypothetical protein